MFALVPTRGEVTPPARIATTEALGGPETNAGNLGRTILLAGRFFKRCCEAPELKRGLVSVA
jgi:hypothetical protein